jgi:hypothetical protein
MRGKNVRIKAWYVVRGSVIRKSKVAFFRTTYHLPRITFLNSTGFARGML